MLIEFTVENFRSIRDEQTFTMEAFGSKFLLENNVGEVELAGGKKMHLLKSAVIYGANASGKSNLIKALYNLCFMITESGSFKVGKGIACYEPFLLDRNSDGKPTCFKITFIGKNNIKYVYEIAYNKDEITSEKLDYYPNGKISNLFKRGNIQFDFDDEEVFDSIDFGSKLEDKKNIKSKTILNNQLFLSKFGENAHKQLTEIYQYFSEIIVGDALDKNDIKRLQEDVSEEINKPKNKHLLMRLNNLIKIADTKIDSVSIKSIQDKLRPFAQHAIYEGDTIVAEKSFNVEEESVGTQVLFTLGFSILKVLDRGGVFIFDELDSSLHPQLSSFLVRLFHNTITNSKNAQIIFSTHEVLLLDKNTFRKDQIWFTEKDKTGATELFSANDFDGVRDDMPFDKWYLAGKFGGTPHIAESKFLLDYA
jgi:AAA15 family ATPase/GTPase